MLPDGRQPAVARQQKPGRLLSRQQCQRYAAAGKIVDHGHSVTGFKQAVDDVAADKSGTTRNENLHAAPLLKTESYTRRYAWAVRAHENESVCARSFAAKL